MAVLDRVLRVLDALGLFLITRFPFIELFVLLMSTGEEAENLPGARTLTFRDTLRREYLLVYINALIFFVCGTGMTLDLKRRKCGLAAALHVVVYTGVTLYQLKKSSEYLIVRMAARSAAVCGGYLFVAAGLTDSQRGQAKVFQALKVSRQILAFYLFCNAYMVWASEEDRLAHIKNIPGGQFMIAMVIALYVIPALSIYAGYEAGYFARIVVWHLVVVSALVDFNTKYWCRSSSHVAFWVQIQHAARNLAVIGSLLLLGRKRYW